MPKKLDENKEQHIIEAARELFARFGFKKTTVDDIAQAAGIAKGTVYLYFKDKKQLLVRIGMYELLASQAALIEELKQEHDPARKLKRIIEQRAYDLYAFVGRFPDAMELLPLLQKKEIEQQGGALYFHNVTLLLREALEEGCAAGWFRVQDAEALIDHILFMGQAFEPPYKKVADAADLQLQLERYTDMLLRAIAAR